VVIFEKEKDLVQCDKFGYEYIDCTKLPEKYDEETKFIGAILRDHAEHIKLFEPTKQGLRLDYVQIRKSVPGNKRPYTNERAWNRLDIHIPINKSVGGQYRFSTGTLGNKIGTMMMFDPLEEWWSVDETKNTHYKLVLRFRNLDDTLTYNGQELNDEV
jgi:hypothetical protein